MSPPNLEYLSSIDKIIDIILNFVRLLMHIYENSTAKTCSEGVLSKALVAADQKYTCRSLKITLGLLIEIVRLIENECSRYTKIVLMKHSNTAPVRFYRIVYRELIGPVNEESLRLGYSIQNELILKHSNKSILNVTVIIVGFLSCSTK